MASCPSLLCLPCGSSGAAAVDAPAEADFCVRFTNDCGLLVRVITRGFRGKRRGGDIDRVPPGQYTTDDFPVLSAGPTPNLDVDRWTLVLEDADRRELHRWTWNELRLLPASDVTVDIHCVTKWSKLDTRWT